MLKFRRTQIRAHHFRSLLGPFFLRNERKKVLLTKTRNKGSNIIPFFYFSHCFLFITASRNTLLSSHFFSRCHLHLRKRSFQGKNGQYKLLPIPKLPYLSVLCCFKRSSNPTSKHLSHSTARSGCFSFQKDLVLIHLASNNQ